MSFLRSASIAAAVLGVVTSGAAPAQTTTPSSSTSSKIDDVSEWTSAVEGSNLTGRKSWSFLASCIMPSTSSKIDDVSKWTSKQWYRAKAAWEKEKEKWADCQRRSKDQNLTGRKSWSFLVSCMTS